MLLGGKAGEDAASAVDLFQAVFRCKHPGKVRKKSLFREKQALFVARRREFESLTFWSVARRSIQLS